MPETIPVSMKTALIDAFTTDLPPGIADFLTTPLPEPPALTMPADVDAAIIVQGQFCAWLANALRPFAGVTPVALPLWIGQLNTVQQGAYVSMLEYLEETETQQGFTITAPAAGKTYLPGDLRVTCVVQDGTVTAMTGTLRGPFDTDFDMLPGADADHWRQELGLAKLGTYTLTITAEFATADQDPQTQTQSLDFTLAAEEDAVAEAEPAGGADLEAVQTAQGKIAEALKALADQNALNLPGYASKWLNVVKVYFGTLKSIGGNVLKGEGKAALEELSTEATGYLDFLYEYCTKPDTDETTTVWDLAEYAGLGVVKNQIGGLLSHVLGKQGK